MSLIPAKHLGRVNIPLVIGGDVDVFVHVTPIRGPTVECGASGAQGNQWLEPRQARELGDHLREFAALLFKAADEAEKLVTDMPPAGP